MLVLMPFSFLFMLMLILGSIFSISSIHWLGVWLGLEVNLIGFIPLLVYRGMKQETESAVKYFIIQSLGSGMLMLGSLLGFAYAESWQVMLTYSSSSLGAYLIIFGLMIKLGSFPFHFWVPSVMAGLSWVNCLILSTWQKLAPIYLLITMMKSWIPAHLLTISLLFFGGFSSIIGGVGGLKQTQIRPLLAYSSIGHVGWLLLSGLSSEILLKIYFLIYFITSSSIFLVLMMYEKSIFAQTGMMEENFPKSSQLYLTFFLLSLGGMPPLIGFVGKLLTLSYASTLFSFTLVVVFITGSLISLFYYLNLMYSTILSSNMTLSTAINPMHPFLHKRVALNLPKNLNYINKMFFSFTRLIAPETSLITNMIQKSAPCKSHLHFYSHLWLHAIRYLGKKYYKIIQMATFTSFFIFHLIGGILLMTNLSLTSFI